MSIMGNYGSYWFKTVNWIALFELIFRSFPKSEFSNRPLTDCVKKSYLMKNWPVETIPHPIDTFKWRPIEKKVSRKVPFFTTHPSRLEA